MKNCLRSGHRRKMINGRAIDICTVYYTVENFLTCLSFLDTNWEEDEKMGCLSYVGSSLVWCKWKDDSAGISTLDGCVSGRWLVELKWQVEPWQLTWEGLLRSFALPQERIIIFPLRLRVLETRERLLRVGGQGKMQLAGVSGCIFCMADGWGGGCLVVCCERGRRKAETWMRELGQGSCILRTP